MKIRAVVAMSLIASMMFVGAPAQADSTTPTLTTPVARVGDTVDVEVMIEAPAKAWGIRRSAKYYDQQIDGLTIHTTGTCYARPLAVCVRVVADAFSDEEMRTISFGEQDSWAGLTTYYPDDPTAARAIYLNLDYNLNRWALRRVGVHELGHALGLAHHSGTDGVMGGVLNLYPSTAELDALRGWYSAA